MAAARSCNDIGVGLLQDGGIFLRGDYFVLDEQGRICKRRPLATKAPDHYDTMGMLQPCYHKMQPSHDGAATGDAMAVTSDRESCDRGEESCNRGQRKLQRASKKATIGNRKSFNRIWQG